MILGLFLLALVIAATWNGVVWLYLNFDRARHFGARVVQMFLAVAYATATVALLARTAWW